jgi:hypothetical protein
MLKKFNRGKPYHGSNAVTDGKLKGETDTDYFYFFCPQCKGRHVLRPLDYAVHVEQPENPYNEQTESKAAKGFTLVFQLCCETCGLKDFVKISNLGWQGGKLPKPMR